MKKIKHEGNLKDRLAKREAAEAAWVAGLNTSAKNIKEKEAAAAGNSTVEAISKNLTFTYAGKMIRDISTFNRSLKSKDRGKITLAVATHLFGKYKVPGYMQECWYSEKVLSKSSPNRGGRWNRRAYWENAEINPTPIVTAEISMRRDWFITQASGGSIYKEHAKGILTKAEVHSFLNCPIPCDFREAIIYALAIQWTKDIGVVSKVMKSKLNTHIGVNWIKDRQIWREVIHFFCVNEIPFQKMNDLFDYFVHSDAQALARQQEYSLKGRNLQSLNRQMQDWHYELARVKRMGNATWEGIPIADAEFEIPAQQPGTIWNISQIKTSKDLAAEGTAMHHCVYSYQANCISGASSIWSVKVLKKKKAIVPERALTLEINENGVIIQIRRFANLPAKVDELEAVKHWARKNYLSISNSRWL